MHGQQNVKICVAEQAKQVYLYKIIKTKLYKNNAAILFNKICRIKQLTATYINVKLNESPLCLCTEWLPNENVDTNGYTCAVLTP
jgi:hypothetical protein